MKNNLSFLKFLPSGWGLWLGLLLFSGSFLIPLTGNFTSEHRCMVAVALLMAVWWMTETLPLGVTALLPLVLYPLLGIMSTADVAPQFMNHLVFLFLGGFILAIALQEWDLHKRFALFTLSLVGSNPRRIILGFMIASAILSMWISNTATAIMMLPIALAVIAHFNTAAKNADNSSIFSTILLLGIAYASSMGGIATIIGTPPNIIFMGIYRNFFPNDAEISFIRWMIFMLPLAVMLFITIWLYLTRIIYRKKDISAAKAKRFFRQQYLELGQLTSPQKWVVGIFFCTALLWIFRSDINFGFFILPGWASLLGLQDVVQDSTVAVGMAILLFIVHARDDIGTESLLKLKHLLQIPWDILLLFGGGFALAEGIQQTGLADYIGQQLSFLGNVPLWPMLFLLTLSVAMLTELTSNTALATTVLPITAGLAIHLEINPLVIMLPAAVASSCAFMLPVATPPNAIIFGSRRVAIQQMVKIGVALNFLVAGIISFYFYLIFR